MDLLLAVQDFLIAWQKGKRENIESVSTPTFAKLLRELPNSHLERLAKKVAGEKLKPHEFRPEATIDGNDAIVKLQRTKGVLVLTMKQTKKGWKVGDAAIESRKDKDQLASARRTATAIRTVVKFLKAYQADDKQELKTIAAGRLYDKCLKVADLKTVPLPSPDSLGDKDVVKTHDKGGEYILQQGATTLKISLLSPSGTVDENSTAPYVVDDVTFYDAKEERRLSAVYTAQAKLQLFMSALIKGNLSLVRENSTKDLNYKVWSKLGSVTLPEILPPEIELVQPTISGADYHGAVTNLYVHQGSRELTYVMRDYSGDVTVDDILMPVMDRPSSMKQTMQAMLPIRLLVGAMRDAASAGQTDVKQLALLRAVTSNDFNRVVWSQMTQVPEPAFAVLSRLDMALASINDSPTGQVVVLGDERFGAKIELVHERDTLLVDRVWMLGPHEGEEAAELKRLLKTQLVRRTSPRRQTLDPMSAHPIVTDPPRSAEQIPTEANWQDSPAGGRSANSGVTAGSGVTTAGGATTDEFADPKSTGSATAGTASSGSATFKP